MNNMAPKAKEERAAYMREYRRNNPEYREKERKYLKQWRKLHPEKIREYNLKRLKQDREAKQKYKLNNPDKMKAHNIARYLPLAPECATCSSKENLEHHHPDYSNPDHTITLCKTCHTKIHWDVYVPTESDQK